MLVWCLGSQSERLDLTIACNRSDIIHVAQAYYGVRSPEINIDCDNPDMQGTDCRSSAEELTADFRKICNAYGMCSKTVKTINDIMDIGLDSDDDFNNQSYIYVEYLRIPGG